MFELSKQNRTLKVVPITDVIPNESNTLCISPFYFGYNTIGEHDPAIREAMQLAGQLDKICLATVHDRNNIFYLSTHSTQNFNVRFKLFNAVACSPEHADFKVITRIGENITDTFWIHFELGQVI